MTARDLVAATKAAIGGVSVALVEQPYRVAGRRSPAPARQLDAAWIAVVEHLRGGPLARPPARGRRTLVGRPGGVPHRGARPAPSGCCAWPSRCIRRAARRRPASPSSTRSPCRRSWSRARATRSACRPTVRRAERGHRARQPRPHRRPRGAGAWPCAAGWAGCSACQTEPMAIRMRDAMSQRLDELRYEPTEKRVRALLADDEVVDSTPRAAGLGAASASCRPTPCRSKTCAASSCRRRRRTRSAQGRRSCTRGSRSACTPPRARPSTAHRRRDARGRGLRAGRPRPGRPRDPRPQGFDAGSRRTSRSSATRAIPFTASTCAAARATVRVERDGALLAESSRAVLLVETSLPTRFYVPREDVVARRCAPATSARLRLQGTRVVPGRSMAGAATSAWSYEDPLHDAAPVTGLVAFFDERVDVVLRRRAPRTPAHAVGEGDRGRGRAQR